MIKLMLLLSTKIVVTVLRLFAAQLAEPHVLKGLNPVPLLPPDLVPVAALELALGAVQLAGPHVIKGLSPGQISDEQVPDRAVPHVQVPAVESHAPGVPPNVQHLHVFLYRWEY